MDSHITLARILKPVSRTPGQLLQLDDQDGSNEQGFRGTLR